MKYQLLKIDLTVKSYDIEEIPGQIIRKFIGGRGLGAYLLYRTVPPKADPLGEENHLLFTAGPASGTGLSYSSKVNINTKSPLTGIYLYSISSGLLAHQMRKAGFWGIDIILLLIWKTIQNPHTTQFSNRNFTILPILTSREILSNLIKNLIIGAVGI